MITDGLHLAEVSGCSRAVPDDARHTDVDAPSRRRGRGGFPPNSQNEPRWYFGRRTRRAIRSAKAAENEALDEHKKYLRDRLEQAGAIKLNATVLLREIRMRGYDGGVTPLKEYGHFPRLVLSGLKRTRTSVHVIL
jgi:hypothetical protein